MIKAIVYESETGFTMKYAKMLEEKTGLYAYLLSNATDDLDKGDEVFYMGWICAGKIKGLKKASKRFDIKGVAAVGISDPADDSISSVKIKNSVDVPFFYLRGGIDLQKLSKIKVKLLEMLAENIERDKNIPENYAEVVDAMRYGADFVKEENLKDVLKFLKSHNSAQE